MTESAPRVLQVLTRLGAGGPPLAVIVLTRELNRIGYDCRLATGHCDHIDLDMSYLLEPDDPVDWVPEMSRSVCWKNDLVALWRLYRLIRSTRPDIVHTHTAKAGALGRIAARLAGVPIVVHTFHGHVLSGYFPPHISAAIRFAERMLAKIAGAICVLAPQQAGDLVERFGVASRHKVHVVPLGLDLEPFRQLPPPQPNGCLTVGWLGRLVEVKDVPLLIGAMEAALAANPRIRFVVAGDGTQRALIEAAARRWRTDRLEWLGWTRDVTGVIARCDVLMQTSRSEGTPIALIQGMAAGRPFLSTAAGGVVDMVAGSPLREVPGSRWYANAVLVDANPQAFTEALCRLERDAPLRAAMGREAAAFAAARHNRESFASHYGRIYSDLLAHRGVRASAAANSP